MRPSAPKEPDIKEPPFPADQSEAPEGSAAHATGMSGLAIGSLILGIVGMLGSITCLGGIAGFPALICGHTALGRIKQSGKRGRGLAIAGGILGFFSTVITVVAVVFLLVEYYMSRTGGGSSTMGLGNRALSPGMSLLIVGILVSVLMAMMAYRKGYNPACWFLAGGVVGLIILGFLPFVNEKSDLPEDERGPKKRIGDGIGLGVSALAVLVTLVAIG